MEWYSKPHSMRCIWGMFKHATVKTIYRRSNSLNFLFHSVSQSRTICLLRLKNIDAISWFRNMKYSYVHYTLSWMNLAWMENGGRIHIIRSALHAKQRTIMRYICIIYCFFLIFFNRSNHLQSDFGSVASMPIQNPSGLSINSPKFVQSCFANCCYIIFKLLTCLYFVCLKCKNMHEINVDLLFIKFMNKCLNMKGIVHRISSFLKSTSPHIAPERLSCVINPKNIRID